MICNPDGALRPTKNVWHGDELYHLYTDGTIGRPQIGLLPSGDWRITCAVEYNNFGRVVRRYSLADILEKGNALPWKFKNGKQRLFIRDMDHGTLREWRNNHIVA